MKKILALFISIIMIIGLCGCGGSSPTGIADTLLKAIKATDAETLKTVYIEEDIDLIESVGIEFYGDTGKTFEEKILDFDYVLSNEIIDGDKASVDVEVTTYSFGDMLTSFITDFFTQSLSMSFSGASDDEIDKMGEELFINKVNELKEKDCTNSATINLVKKDDVWVVDKIDDELLNALTGGMIGAIELTEDELFSVE